MKLVYTEQAIKSLQESLAFLAPNISLDKLATIQNQILDTADTLLSQPFLGQVEPFLQHLNLDHRRIITGHFKIIYRVSEEYIYITDIFDSRQDPDKMNG